MTDGPARTNQLARPSTRGASSTWCSSIWPTQGLHPILGEAGDPGAPAADLLRALGIQPARRGEPADVRGRPGAPHRDQDGGLRRTADARDRAPVTWPSPNVAAGRGLSHVESRIRAEPMCDATHRDFRPCSKAGPREERGDDESPKRGEGPPEDPGAGLGAAVPRAGVAVRNGLHVPEGAEEGPAEAGPAVLLPDAGREGPPGLRRRRRRHPRQHVPPGAGALAGVAEAVPVHHPAAGDLGGAGHAAAVPHRARTRSCTTARRSR